MATQSAQAALDEQTHLSLPDPRGDEPPQLSAAINELVFAPERGPTGEDAHTFEPADKLRGPDGAVVVEAVCKWVCTVLETVPIDMAWFAPAGRTDHVPENLADETWARVVTQMFLGCGYGGPEIIAGFTKSSPFRGAPYRRVMQRLQQKHATLETSASPLATLDQLEWHENTDPAYSLISACQSQVTMALLARGFVFETDFNMSGIPASQHARRLRVFDDKHAGRWFGTEKDETMGAAAEEAIRPEALGVKAAVEASIPLAAGTIYTFNPYLNVKTKRVFVPKWLDMRASSEKFSDFYIERAIAEATDRQNADRRDAVADLSKESAKLGKGDEAMRLELKNRIAEIEPASQATSNPLDYETDGTYREIKLTMQTEGSHVSCVLRRWKSATGEPRVQLLDTTAHGGRGSRISDLPSAAGMYDGAALDTVSGSAKFTGIGVLPAQGNVLDAALFARKARPVGLARLVVTANGKGETGDADILLISRLVRTWADAPTQNYYPSSFLLSLRNLPYYQSVRAYWFLYAPRLELADFMWAEGARTRSVEAMVADAKTLRAKHNETRKEKKPFSLSFGDQLWPASVLASVGDQVRFVWQSHLSPTGKGTIPKKLRQLLLGYALLPSTDPRRALFEDPTYTYVNPTLVDTYDAMPELPAMLRPA